jgi:hypothetical protein
MRTSLFLSAMFAVTLVASAASAERPDHRRKGDMVEKNYSKAHARPGSERASQHVAPAQQDPRKSPGESRWNCGDDEGCRTHRSPTVRTRHESSSRAAQSQPKGMKVNNRAEQRWNCGPTDDNCQGVRSVITRSESLEAKGKTAAERAANERLGQANKGTTVSDRMKSDKDKDQTQLNAAQKRLAEKLQAMLKAKLCEKHASECDSK